MTIASTEMKDALDRTRASESTPKRKKGGVGWVAGGGLIVVLMLAAGIQLSGVGRAGAEGTLVNTFPVKPMDFQVSLKEKGELKALNSVDVKCEVEGMSTIIWIVDEGKMVEEGDLLVELASEQIDEKVQTAEISVAVKEAGAGAAKSEFEIQKDQNNSDIVAAELEQELAELALKQYLEGDWIQQETEARLAMREAESEHIRAKDASEASERLYKDKFITKVELDNDLFAFEKARYGLEKANLGYEILKKYTHTMDLKKAQEAVREAIRDLARVKLQAKASLAKAKVKRDAAMAELDLTQKRLEKYKEQKGKTKILAPAPGLVVYHSERYSRSEGIKEGANVRQRQTMIRLPDTSLMTVEVRIHETKTNQISVDQPVVVTVDGLPDKRFTGKVTKIGVLADSRDRWLNRDLKEYETQITLDQSDPDLKPGASAQVEILVDHLSDVLAVPVQAVFSKGGRNYVFIQHRSKESDPIEVTLGQSSEEYVEIVNGLASGQKVMLGISEEMKRKVQDTDQNESPGKDAVARGGRSAPSLGSTKAKSVTERRTPKQKSPNDDRRADRARGKDRRSRAVQ